MSKKARFVVDPQKFTVSFISEGEAIKNPKRLIEATQKFYESKGMNIPATVFENAYKKEMLAEKKIYFSVNPLDYTVEFVNKSNLPVYNKKKLIESATKFFNKTNYKIPRQVFMEAVEDSERMGIALDSGDGGYSKGIMSTNPTAQFITAYGLDDKATDPQFMQAVDIVVSALAEKGVEVKQLNSSIYEASTPITPPDDKNKEIHAKINPATGDVESQELVNKNTPSNDKNTIVVKPSMEAVEPTNKTDMTLAGLANNFSGLIDSISKLVIDDLEDDGTLDKINKIKMQMAQLIAKKDPNAALSQNAINTTSEDLEDPVIGDYDDLDENEPFITEAKIDALVKLLAEKRQKVTINAILEALGGDDELTAKRKIIMNNIKNQKMGRGQATKYAAQRGMGTDEELAAQITNYFVPTDVQEVDMPQMRLQQYNRKPVTEGKKAKKKVK